METITCTPADLAAAFTEWERRYREEPERFMAEARRLLQETPESYGEACAPYFLILLHEAGEASADPRRRALAAGWWPPPPDSDRFWLHPEHGPVHEDDLAGVLRREAGAAAGVPVGEESSLQEPVRRVEGGTSGEVVTAGADVTAEGVSVETMRWPAPKAGAGPS